MKIKQGFSQTICLDNCGRSFIKPSVSGEYNIPDELIAKAVSSNGEAEKASEDIVDICKNYEALILQIYNRTKKKNEQLHIDQQQLEFEQKQKEIDEIDFSQLKKEK